MLSSLILLLYRTRGVEIGRKDISLTHLEEAYTTEHWLVRIYKVKDFTNRDPRKDDKKWRQRSHSKTYAKGKGKEGVVKNKPSVVKGKRGKGKARR
jgi:dolichyl-diphosphooligosaccharide--protein glycosyltransferase